MTGEGGSQGLRGRLLGLFGQTRSGDVDTRAASQRLGVSEQTVRRWAEGTQEPSKRSAQVLADVERSEAHRPKWIAAGDEGAVGRGLTRDAKIPVVQDIRGQLLTAFGRKDGTLDTGKAATDLGVSSSTVRRWFTGEARPKIGNQTKIRQATRQAAVDTKRGSRLKNMGSAFSMNLTVTVSNDTRTRSLKDKFSAADMDAILTAWAEGGDTAAQAAIEAALNAGYARDFGMSVDAIHSVNLPRNR